MKRSSSGGRRLGNEREPFIVAGDCQLGRKVDVGCLDTAQNS